MAIWAVVSTAFTSISMLLNGATVVKFQIIVSSIMAIASIGASIVLAGAFGLSGVIWGTLLAFVVIAAGPTLWYLPRLFRQLASDPPTARPRRISRSACEPSVRPFSHVSWTPLVADEAVQTSACVEMLDMGYGP